jgi:hypothetical protein
MGHVVAWTGLEATDCVVEVRADRVPIRGEGYVVCLFIGMGIVIVVESAPQIKDACKPTEEGRVRPAGRNPKRDTHRPVGPETSEPRASPWVGFVGDAE